MRLVHGLSYTLVGRYFQSTSSVMEEVEASLCHEGQRLYDPSDHLFKRLLSALFLINHHLDPPVLCNLVI